MTGEGLRFSKKFLALNLCGMSSVVSHETNKVRCSHAAIATTPTFTVYLTCAPVNAALYHQMAPQDLQHGYGSPGLDLTSLSQTVYALSRQKLNELIKKLRDCGTEGVIRLPKIAVIGSQSAGKSSLIEAISKIKLPRKAGTACTRCPMEVILSSEKGPCLWICKISLRYDHEVLPFAETTNKDDVTLLLRRAQLAILNPERRIEEFIGLSESECDSEAETVAIQFSRDTVVIEISGAEVDVTFIDLPGIISHTEKVHMSSISN
jgi:hypothetical protein